MPDSSAFKTDNPSSVKVTASAAVRIRVRCKNNHKDPWLRRLYVVWATIPAPPPAPPSAQVFQVGLTDNEGNLLAAWDEEGDVKPGKAIPMFPGVEYDMYFVRWPSQTFADDLAADINAKFAETVKKHGPPHRIKVERLSTGSSIKGKPLKEGVIKVEEKPEIFLPLGSNLYGKWVLFRNMPGTGSNQKDKDIQCDDLRKQVRRLQFHMGRLRYPIGNNFHPYTPEPFGHPHKEDNKFDYPNEGIFDVCLWNAVLSWQRDAKLGNCFQLSAAPEPKFTGEHFDVPSSVNPILEVEHSLSYLSGAELSGKVTLPNFADKDERTVVDEQTGDGIWEWLKNSYRKPGRILISPKFTRNPKVWIRDDLYPRVKELTDILVDCKVIPQAKDFFLTCSFRDARMSVSATEDGQVAFSIHKSGIAMDMAFADYTGPNKQLPIYFEKAPPIKDDVGVTRWITYMLVAEKDVKSPPPHDYIEYKDTIDKWDYDPASRDGGKAVAGFSEAGKKFINFSRICEKCELKGISAQGTKWHARPEAFKITKAKHFKTFVSALDTVLTLLPKSEVVIDGTAYSPSALKEFYSDINLWQAAQSTAGLSPSLVLDVQPWTKTGEKTVLLLRDAKLKGFKASAVVNGYWKEGRGAKGFELNPDQKLVEKPPAKTAGVFTLGPETEFPASLSFQLQPLTTPLLKIGSEVSYDILGKKESMEWWHFQWDKGYAGKRWYEILASIGWTEEGLLAPSGNKLIHGLHGLGYGGNKEKGSGIYKRAT